MNDEPSPGTDALGHALLLFAPRLTHAIRHRLGRLAPSLTYRQYRILLHVSGGATSLTALRAPSTVSLSTLSEIVDSLVRRELIVREPSTHDRRSVELALTASGSAALAAAQHALDDLVASVLNGVHPTDADALKRTITAVDANVQAILAEEHGR